jgi:S-adenosylmethionine hydrolase
MGVLTLLTDFGTADYYVAAVKGVILAAAPQTTLVDVSHEVPAGDVATAAFLLAAVAPCFPRGTVHLAVVDPGVGSPRRLLAVATAEARFLAPDNGLLTPVFGAGCEIRAVTREDLFRPAPGATFHGRDRFAPIAAWLLCDGDFAALGPVIADPVRLPVFSPERLADRLVGRVVHVDRYGNMVTDIPAAWLPDRPCRARLGSHSTSRRVSHYEAIPAGDAAMLTGSLGTVELSARGEDLARRWNAQRGDAVVISWSPPSVPP